MIHTARVQRLVREKLGWPVLSACDWVVSGACGESGPVIACVPFNLRSLTGTRQHLRATAGRSPLWVRYHCGRACRPSGFYTGKERA